MHRCTEEKQKEMKLLQTHLSETSWFLSGSVPALKVPASVHLFKLFLFHWLVVFLL